MNRSHVLRRAEKSTARRLSWLTLGVAVALAGALAFGDVWFARVGVAVAAAGGLFACLLIWRVVREQRTAFLAQSTLDARAHGDKLHDERLQHVHLLQVLQSRNGELRTQVVTARAEAGRTAQDIAALRGDNVALRLEVSRLTEAHSAEILALPKRVSGPISEHEEILWAEGNMPTVVDLKAVTAPFSGDIAEQRHA